MVGNSRGDLSDVMEQKYINSIGIKKNSSAETNHELQNFKILARGRRGMTRNVLTSSMSRVDGLLLMSESRMVTFAENVSSLVQRVLSWKRWTSAGLLFIKLAGLERICRPSGTTYENIRIL